MAAREYVIRESDQSYIVDLNEIDWNVLERALKHGRARTAVERLRALLERQVVALVRLNPARVDLVERLRQMIDEYNAGSINAEELFRRLKSFADALDEESKRAIGEG